MSNTAKENDDLKTLQYEAAELEKSRKLKISKEKNNVDQPHQDEPVEVVEQTASDAQGGDTLKDEVDDLTSQLETYLKEIEETAMERPALALLTTFALGIIVGHLFTRK